MATAREVYEHVGRRVAEIRRSRGLTQEQLAERADVSAGYLARIESGTKRATVDTLNAIAVALGEPLGALFPSDEPAALPRELVAVLRRLDRDDLALLARVGGRFVRRPRRAR